VPGSGSNPAVLLPFTGGRDPSGSEAELPCRIPAPWAVTASPESGVTQGIRGFDTITR
jgi:hypothetical protein